MAKTRLYQPIWEALKRDKIATIRVHHIHASRVKKAVTKEKDNDVIAKEIAAEEGERFVLRTCYDALTKIMTFTLEGRLGIEEVSLEAAEAEKLI